VCASQAELLDCISLKLLIANATHTSVVYSMALSGRPSTSCCIREPLFLRLVEAVFWQDILPAFGEERRADAVATFREWLARLQHPHFDMSSFFVCQNATQKLCEI
jgi:mannitol-1-phosphate/altronate dehydrogenase